MLLNMYRILERKTRNKTGTTIKKRRADPTVQKLKSLYSKKRITNINYTLGNISGASLVSVQKAHIYLHEKNRVQTKKPHKTHTHIHIYTYIYTYTHLHTHIYIHIHTNM